MSNEQNNSWAVIKDGVVANVIIWDGESEYQADGELKKLSDLPTVPKTMTDEDGNETTVECPPSIGESVQL